MNKHKVYLFHGIMNDNGKNSTDRLRPILARDGHDVVEVDYGEVGALNARVVNKSLARAIAAMAEPYSIAIGHSNGCALIHLASHQGAHFDKIFYINPAIGSHLTPSKLCSECHVYYSPDDDTVRLARIGLGEVGGDMGRVGYTPLADEQRDYRMSNMSINRLLGVDTLEHAHSAVFRDEYIEDFTTQLAIDML